MTDGSGNARDTEEAPGAGDLRGAERRAASTLAVGGLLIPAATLIGVLALSYALHHSGLVRGYDVLFGTGTAEAAATTLPERIHAVLKLLTILLAAATLIVRQAIVGFVTWVVAGINMWYAFAAGWMRQSRPAEGPGGGVGFGLWVSIIASAGLFIVLCFLVFRKSAAQVELALARREEAHSDPVLRAQQVYLRSGLTPHTRTDGEIVDDRREASRRRRAARRGGEATGPASGAATGGDAAAGEDAAGA